MAVVALYGGYAGAMLGWLLRERGTVQGALGLGLVAAGTVAALAGLAGVILSRQALSSPVFGALDERQRNMRDRAYRTGYRVLGVVVIAAALFILFRPAVGDGPNAAALIIAGGLVLVALSLPTSIMAWTEPDPPEDSGSQPMVHSSHLRQRVP